MWHPNTQMSEWGKFPKIVKGRGMYLFDSHGKKYLDGVASMWCNVWGHSKKELVQVITSQSKKIQHSSMFNLTNEPAEELAKNLVKVSPGMKKVFYSDNGSTAMEIAFKMALQYWHNSGNKKKSKFASLENGYHGDTFGAMSVGYIPEFFSKFQTQLFPVKQIPTPNKYRLPQNKTIEEYQNCCLEKLENLFSREDKYAAFVMESGAQLAGGVIIYPKNFQKRIAKICKNHDVLLILDEVATGFGRLGSMTEYTAQNCRPDIVSFGKMLTGGYITMGATLASKKIYNSFNGEFNQWKHLFHGHTFTGNPLAAAVATKNLEMYNKYNLISRISQTAKIFKKYYEEIKSLELVGDIRHKGMLMGIELVSDKNKKTPIHTKKSINKVFFDLGIKNGIYLRTLGNILMLVPPLAISTQELSTLIEKAILTIKTAKRYVKP